MIADINNNQLTVQLELIVQFSQGQTTREYLRKPKPVGMFCEELVLYAVNRRMNEL